MDNSLAQSGPDSPLNELVRLDRAYDLEDKNIGELLTSEDKETSLAYIQASLESMRIKQEQVALTGNWIEAEMYYLIDRFKLYEGQTYVASDGSIKPYRSFTKWAASVDALTRVTTLRVSYRFRRRFNINRIPALSAGRN